MTFRKYFIKYLSSSENSSDGCPLNIVKHLYEIDKILQLPSIELLNNNDNSRYLIDHFIENQL